MSLHALRADATCWDLHVLGCPLRSCARGDGEHAATASQGARTSALYDVKDPARERPLEVFDDALQSPFALHGQNTWRIYSSVLPYDCKSPLWLPASLTVAREVRVPTCIVVNSCARVSLRAASAELVNRLALLKPEGSRLTVSWETPLLRVSLPPQGSLADQIHVGGVIMGPKLQVTLRRDAARRLELLELEGGPEGAGEVAAAMFREALDEIDAARESAAELAAETDKRNKLRLRVKEKVVLVFGKTYRPDDENKHSDALWDAEAESFVLWSALQQWERMVKRQPWRWGMHYIESVGNAMSKSALLQSGELRLSPRTPNSPWNPNSPRTPRIPHASSPRTPKTLGSTLKRSRTKPLASSHGSGSSNQILAALLRGFDKDGSGDIDWPEFRDTSKRLMDLVGPDSTWTEAAAREEFEACDVNGDGIIVEEEWLAFAGQVLAMVSNPDTRQRILALLGQDVASFTTRTLSAVQGDVDVGLSCKNKHVIRPLRIKSWGEQVAKSIGLGTGFRCAEVDDPIAYAAAWRQRCTRCNAVDSQATFIVTCIPCGQAFCSGWWCTKCVMEVGHPRDRFGCCVRVQDRHRQGNCHFCREPAITAWPTTQGETEQLCHEHAADRLLEEAARCSAAGGREPKEGPSLLVSCEFMLEGFDDDDDDDEDREKFSRLVENEISCVLALEGAPPDRLQLEVARIWPDEKGDSVQTGVQLVMTRAFGRPSPYELFLRLRSLAVDLDGPLYSAQYEILSSLRSLPEAVDVVVSEKTEQIEMTARVTRIVAECWPHGGPASRTLLVVRPPRVTLPYAIVLSLRCLKPPENIVHTADGRLVAYALAFPEGVRKTMPKLYEFEAVLAPKGKNSVSRASAVGARSSTASTTKCTEGRGSVAKSAPKRRESKKPAGKSRAAAESGSIVCMSTGPGGSAALLEGESTLLGLKPGTAYDVFVALFVATEVADEIEAAYQEPVAATQRVIRTGPKTREVFGSDADGVVQLQTEEPHVARKECFLKLLGLDEAPCVIDQNSCKITLNAGGREPLRSNEILAEHGVTVVLEEAETEIENPAMAGGVQLHTPTLIAKPTYEKGHADFEVTVSADIVGRPCPKHCFSCNLDRPLALSLRGQSTEARCCKPQADLGRCQNCEWTKIEQKHVLSVVISIDLVRMAELGDWHSVDRRVHVCHPHEVRAAMPTVLHTRPQLETDLIMRVFEGCTGRLQEVDFPVRPDGATALHVAIEENHLDAVQSLLRRKMDPSVANAAGETALHAVARGGSSSATQVAEILMAAARSTWRGEEYYMEDKAIAKQSLLDSQDVKGRTVLHYAAANDQQPLTRQLLSARADPRIQDRSGCNALHAAAAAGAMQCTAALLLAPGVSVNNTMSESRGYTALHLACERCNANLAMLLLQKKASPEMLVKSGSVGGHGLNLLVAGASQWAHYRGLGGVVDVARQLVRRGKPPEPVIFRAGASMCDFALWAAGNDEMMNAVQEILALLSESGLDRPAALSVAMLNRVAAATGESAATDRRDDNRVTHAQTPGNATLDLPGAVGLALELSADPNAADSNGDTALHMLMRYPAQRRVLPDDRVAGEGIARTVHALVERRANPHARNKNGQKPMALAQRLLDLGEHYGRSWQEVFVRDGDRRKRSVVPKLKAAGLQTRGDGEGGVPKLSLPALPPDRGPPPSASTRASSLVALPSLADASSGERSAHKL